MKRAIATFAAALVVAFAPVAARADGSPRASDDDSRAAAVETGVLAFGGEARLRYVSARNARLVPGNDTSQLQLRALVHADYRVGPRFRVHGEVGTAQVDRGRAATGPSLQNRASLQQLYVDVDNGAGDDRTRLGAKLGRQEFAEGPRQLLSAGDGASLRRSWNGVRVYAKTSRYTATVFELRATRLAAGAFDDGIRGDTGLRGVIADIAVARRSGGDASLQPFWLQTTTPAAAVAGGKDARDTLGARLAGSRGPMRWDWTIAHQQGDAGARDVQAWAVFAVQSLALSDGGWKPRLTSHIDIASRDFHPLYASSSYLGEGQFLGLTNLLLVAPGIAVAPTPRTTLSLEFGHARRLDDAAAAQAGGLRAYSGTAGSRGRHVGNLTRFSAGWNASSHLALSFSAEHFAAGTVLDQAGLASGTYLQLSGAIDY